MAVSYIFCEGTETSLDKGLLEKLGIPLLSKVVPVGGKGEMANFIKGYFSEEKAREDTRYIAFRDRDFEIVEIPKREQAAKLHQLHPTKPIFALHRVVIENYLLTPELLYYYLQQSNEGLGAFGISDASGVHQLIEEAAHSIYYYAIARHVIGDLKRNQPRIASTWERESGILPPIDERTPEALQQAITKHFQPLHGYTATLAVDSLVTLFLKMEQRMPLSRFLQRDKPHDNYQTYCHGKDLIAATEERLAALLGLRQYTLGEKWRDFALANFDYTRFPDLIELRTLITSQP